MHARFYAPDAHSTGDTVRLPPEEAEHLTRVLRLGPADRVRVFNGRGLEFEAIVSHVSRNEVSVRLETSRVPAAEASVSITLVQAILKGDKMDAVVRDAAMLGASAMQPIVTARTEVSLAAIARGRRLERWRRIAISSTKQCGRAVVPVVYEPCAVDQVPRAITNRVIPSPALMLVEPGASSDVVRLSEIDASRPAEAALLVGPEGGWAPEEIDSLGAVCRLVSLGGRTLRADSIAVIGLTAALTLWKDF